jgi:hypothetical protein
MGNTFILVLCRFRSASSLQLKFVQAATLAQVPDYLITKFVLNYNSFDFFLTLSLITRLIQKIVQNITSFCYG